MKRRAVFVGLAALFLLSACSTFDFLGSDDKKKTPLEGERISILELQKNLQPDSLGADDAGVLIPPPMDMSVWPQVGGFPGHAPENIALNPGELEEAWSADIGAGTSSQLPLTAQPIIADGKIFTLDSEQILSALAVDSGKEVWRIETGNPNEDDVVIGGGLSYDAGQLFVTNGFNEILTVNAKDGKIIWRKALPAPARAAPTVMGGRVFVTTLNNTLQTFDARTGMMLWDYASIGEATGVLGAASPAADNEVVIPAFSSGEIYALRVENGSVAWSDDLSPVLRIGGMSDISDIRGLPVIHNGVVYAISFGGKLAAIDERSGTRIWSRDISGSQTPWISGNHIFVLSSSNELVALNKDTGAIRWVRTLDRFKDKDSREDAIFWAGPVMAGNRLILAGNHGIMAEINPQTGEVLRRTKTGKSVSIPPVVAGKSLYLLADDGTLLVYR